MGLFSRRAIEPVPTLTPTVNTRDPKAATMRMSYGAKGMPMVPEWNAEQAIRYAYLANIIVNRAMRIKANDLAGCPFRAGRDPLKLEDYKPDAPLAKFFGPPPGGPNAVTTADDLFAWSIIQYELTGRMAWEIETATDKAKTPISFWPLTVSNLEAVPTESGAQYFKEFIYGNSAEKRKLSREQIFYFWLPSQTDYRQPESPLQAARLDISISSMQDRYDHAFLANGGIPANLIVTYEFVDEEAKRAFEDELNAKYGGPDNAGKNMVIEQRGDDTNGIDKSIKIEQLGLSQVDAEFVARYEQKFRAIAIACGVPWSKFDASGRTYDNEAGEDRTYWVNEMQPKMRRLQNAINLQIAPRVGPDVGWFETSHIEALRPPKKFLPVTGSVAKMAAIATTDEIREDWGLSPEETLDEPLSSPEPVAPPASSPPIEVQLAPAAGATANPEPVTKSKRQIMTPADMELRRQKIWNDTNRTASMIEARMERKFKALFARQEKATIDRLEGKRGRQAVNKRDANSANAVFDENFWRAETIAMTNDIYADIMEAGAQRLIGGLAFNFELEQAFVDVFVQARSNRLAGYVTDTTYRAIKDAMVQGIADGAGISEEVLKTLPDGTVQKIESLASRIQRVFSEASDYRASMIARTEVISAYNGASDMVANSLPADVVGGKEWIATRDGRERGEHGGADGQIVGTGEAFDVGGEALDYPGDPNGSAGNTINCRCTPAFLTPEEMADFSLLSMSGAASKPSNVIPLKKIERQLARVALGAS
jgi:hypothetical protein